MAKATESLERAEHAAHAGHHGGHDAGHEEDKLPTRIGITMAMLGVVLAFSAAKLGAERTELVRALVDQQNAHAKYQAQDIKHRSAAIALRQLHATATGTKANGDDLLLLAHLVDRYYHETQSAREWVESFEPKIHAHVDGQEEYEHAELAAELGIVIASIALLLRRRAAWLLAIALGLTSVGLLASTWLHVRHENHAAEAKIEATGHAYRELRTSGKATNADVELIEEIKKTHGAK